MFKKNQESSFIGYSHAVDIAFKLESQCTRWGAAFNKPSKAECMRALIGLALPNLINSSETTQVAGAQVTQVPRLRGGGANSFKHAVTTIQLAPSSSINNSKSQQQQEPQLTRGHRARHAFSGDFILSELLQLERIGRERSRLRSNPLRKHKTMQNSEDTTAAIMSHACGYAFLKHETSLSA